VSNAQAHWQRVYNERDPREVSWYEREPERSLSSIEATGIDHDAAILDVGGGTSHLAAGLLTAGYTDVTVTDIADSALERARTGLGEDAERVTWIQADLRGHRFDRAYNLWHDRAVFHFMVTDADRQAYLATLRETLRPGGHLLIATFGPGGPARCSGLPVVRYDADALARALGPGFSAASSTLEDHTTPSGAEQQFLWARFSRDG
jgi:SAM-dependent methyltransferase